MKPETLEALLDSIKHWEKNVKAAKVYDASIYGGECALCERFRQGEDNCDREDGERCPVFERTGHRNCIKSPWTKAFYAWECWAEMPDEPNVRLEFIKAAQVEVDFLKSLVNEDATVDD